MRKKMLRLCYKTPMWRLQEWCRSKLDNANHVRNGSMNVVLGI